MSESHLPRPRPSLSITLPPTSEFHYSKDGKMPKTPDMPEPEAMSAQEPPPPPRQAFRVRRKPRSSLTAQEPEILGDHIAIPTIEMSEAASDSSSPVLGSAVADAGLLSPLPAMQRLGSEPHTPAPRLAPSFGSPTNEWSLIHNSRQQREFERANSVDSTFSDSSVSSCDSSDFSAPINGSCASPSSEFAEVFTGQKDGEAVMSPDHDSSPPRVKRVKFNRQTKWTPAMDDHLWMTFMQYISDPRVTPFKSLPGTAPPLGVCSRVASKARRTWSQYKQATPVPMEQGAREGSLDTIRAPIDMEKQPQWPRREKEGRRRLKDLCRRRPSLHAHYQRLLRSPSPFVASSETGGSSQPSNSFSGRELNISLTTATAPSMQPEGPLAQLAQGNGARPQSQRESRPSDWFARIGRSQAHQKSISLQTGLQLELARNQADGVLAGAAAETDRNHLLQSMAATRSLGRADLNQRVSNAPALDSPVQFQRPSTTFPRSLKRRFKSDEEKPRRAPVTDAFTRTANGAVGARTRGFSLGAVRASDNLVRLFAPREQDEEMIEAPTEPAVTGTPAPVIRTTPARADDVFAPPVVFNAMTGINSAPRRLAEPVPRLGSPFVARNNTFPRSFQPTPDNPQPFQTYLRQLAAEHAERAAAQTYLQ